ncbi:hypothetical protein Aperf_G00000121783 [Anoplocephala perfoliata]
MTRHRDLHQLNAWSMRIRAYTNEAVGLCVVHTNDDASSEIEMGKWRVREEVILLDCLPPRKTLCSNQWEKEEAETRKPYFLQHSTGHANLLCIVPNLVYVPPRRYASRPRHHNTSILLSNLLFLIPFYYCLHFHFPPSSSHLPSASLSSYTMPTYSPPSILTTTSNSPPLAAPFQ